MAGFLEALRAALAAADVDEGTTRKVEIRIRQKLGGSMAYIPSAKSAKKVELVGRAVADGLPLKTAFEVAGVSRRTGYRILSKPWRK